MNEYLPQWFWVQENVTESRTVGGWKALLLPLVKLIEGVVAADRSLPHVALAQQTISSANARTIREALQVLTTGLSGSRETTPR